MASNISYALHFIRDYMKLFGILKLFIMCLLIFIIATGNNIHVVSNSLTYNIYHLMHKVIYKVVSYNVIPIV